MIEKSCFLLDIITARTDKLENLISFQNCHLSSHGRAMNTGIKLLRGESSRQWEPVALGTRAGSTADVGQRAISVFQVADLLLGTGESLTTRVSTGVPSGAAAPTSSAGPVSCRFLRGSCSPVGNLDSQQVSHRLCSWVVV